MAFWPVLVFVLCRFVLFFMFDLYSMYMIIFSFYGLFNHSF
jgi:hypothetical protein